MSNENSISLSNIPTQTLETYKQDKMQKIDNEVEADECPVTTVLQDKTEPGCGMKVLFIIRSITVEPVLFLYMTAAFLSFPTFQSLLYDKICYDKYGSQANYSAICDNLTNPNVSEELHYVQGETSLWILYITLCYTFPSCITAAFVGSWSDHYGKKIVMLLPFIGGGCEKIFGLFAAIYLEEIPIWSFLFGALIAGSTGNFAVAIQTVFSYISDITTIENRSSRVAVLEAMTFIGGLTASILVSVLLGKVPTYQLYVIILILYFIGASYTVIRIRNVIPPQRHSEGYESKFLFNLHHVKECMRSTFMYREDGRRTDILLLMLAMCLYVVAAAGERDVIYLFLINKPLQWSPNEYGYLQFYYYTLLSICLVLCLPLLRKYLHMRDLSIGIIGGVSKCVAYIILSLSVHTWMVYVAVTAGALSLMSVASVRSVLSKCGAPDEQGKLFAVLASLESLSGVVATSIFNPVYKASLPIWTGLCFTLCAVLLLLMILVLSCLRYRMRNVVTESRTFQALVNDSTE